MAITNIDTTTDNGVKRITNTQTATGISTIDGECVVLDDDDSRLETDNSNGQVLVDRSTIILDSDVTGNNNDNSVINYGGRGVTTTKMQFRQSVILINALSGRKNIQVTELSDTKIIEGDDTRRMFLYTGTNAIIKNVYIRGIQVWEIYRSPAELFNVIVDVCNMGYLNWEAGRIDLFGFDVINPATGHAWQGTGNSGNNHMWHWNNGLNFDNTKMYLTSNNNRYYEGFTIAWKFLDRRTGLSAANVKVKINDDFAGNGASMIERGEFITNSEGLLVGTWDSKFRTSGSNIVRDVIYLVKNAVTRLGSNDTLDFPIDTINNEQGDRRANYTIDAILNQIEIKSYNHLAPDGHIVNDTFTINSEIGKLTSTGAVDVYQNFIMVSDLGITELDIAVPMAYTALETLDKIYDRIKAEWRDNNSYPLPTFVGVSMDLGSVNLWIDGLSGAYDFIDGSYVLLGVNADDKNLSLGTNVKEITASNTTLDRGATINGLTVNGDVTIKKVVDFTGVTISENLNSEVSSSVIAYNTPDATRIGDSDSLNEYNEYEVIINAEITTSADITTGQIVWESGGAGSGIALVVHNGIFKLYVGEDASEYCNTFPVNANTKYQVSVVVARYEKKVKLYVVEGNSSPTIRDLKAISDFTNGDWVGTNGTGVGNVNGATRSPITGDFLGTVKDNTINIYTTNDISLTYTETITKEDATITLDNTKILGLVVNNNPSNTLTLSLTNGSSATADNAGTGNGQVNIVSLVSIDINVKDSGGNNVVGALVYVDEDLDVIGNIVNTTTDVNGNVTTSYSGGATNATIRVRKYGYKFSVGSISLSNNSQTTVVLITDPQQI